MALCFTAVARAQNKPVDGSGADPEAERRSFKVADGFEVNLFAADPMVVKPIQMNFDERGRLWVTTSETYPQLKPGDVPNDKIFILEDTDGDGRADKSTLFAEGLFLPHGVVPGDGGAYAANSTEMVHFKDTNGDDKADQKQVILAGFGTEDTHHILHTFRWGPDGRLYIEQSIYIHSQIETPFGIKKLDAGGVWRVHPKTQAIEVYFTGLVNGWGYCWDKWGQTFATDGAGGEGINFVVPGCSFTAAAGAQRVLKGLNPGSPKYCGLEILSGRHIPDDHQGVMVTNDFRANRVVRFKVTDDGAGFSSKLLPDFITSTDKAFRPIDVKMGPDGAIYIADWYNPIINHGEVDFRDTRRDKTHGRIWRVTAKGRPLVAKPKIAGATVEALFDLLTVPEGYTRQMAKNQLRAVGAKDVAPALAKWLKGLKKQDGKAFDVEEAKLEALWVYQGIDTVEPKLLAEVLASPNPDARAAAARVTSQWAKLLENPASLLSPLVTDENPRVRMEAVRALAAIGSPESVTIAMKALDKPLDPFLDYALFKTATDLQDVWLPAFKAGKLTTWADPKHLNFALQAVKSPDALKTILAQLKAGQTPAEARKDVFGLIASIGSDADLSTMLDFALHGQGLPPADRAAALRGVERATRQRKLKPANVPAAEVGKLFAEADGGLASAAMRLAGTLKLDLRAPLEQAAGAPATEPAVRTAAVEALADIGADPAASTAFFQKLAGATNPPAVRSAGVAGLALVDPKAAGASAADLFATAKAGDDLTPVMAAFFKKEGGSEALAASLSGKKITPDVAKLSLRYIQGVGQALPELTDVLRKSAGLGDAAKPLTADEIKQLVAEVTTKGDPARGERVFRTPAAGCFQCHMIGGAGGPLAPDLRAVGAASPIDYLIESVLLPNKAIKDGYDSLLVYTKDGDVIQGIKVRGDAKELVLRDNLRDEIVIAEENIKSRKPGGSLMPAGLADNLTHQEFVDLVRFLSELGKPGPYAIPNNPVVRRWRVLDVVPDTSATGAPATPPIGDAGWLPAYSQVSGVLPADATVKPGKTIGVVRADLDVTTAGPVTLMLGSTKGLAIWIDGRPAQLSESGATAELAKGMHMVTIRIDTAVRPEGLRLEIGETTAGRATPVGGR